MRETPVGRRALFLVFSSRAAAKKEEKGWLCWHQLGGGEEKTTPLLLQSAIKPRDETAEGEWPRD